MRISLLALTLLLAIPAVARAQEAPAEPPVPPRIVVKEKAVEPPAHMLIFSQGRVILLPRTLELGPKSKSASMEAPGSATLPAVDPGPKLVPESSAALTIVRPKVNVKKKDGR